MYTLNCCIFLIEFLNVFLKQKSYDIRTYVYLCYSYITSYYLYGADMIGTVTKSK